MSLDVTASTAAADAALAGTKALAEDLGKTAPVITPVVDDAPAVLTLGELKAQLDDLTGQVWDAQAGVEDAAAEAELAKLTAELAALNDTVAEPKISEEGLVAAQARLAAIQAQFAALSGEDVLHIDTNAAQVAAEETALAAAERSAGEAAASAVPDLIANAAAARSAGDAAKYAYAAQVVQSVALKDTGDAAGDTTVKLAGLTAATTAAGNAGRGAYGVWGLLARDFALFGGAATIAGWHLMLDLAIETAAVGVPAIAVMAAGLTAFGITGAAAGQDVYQHLQSVYTVSQATGQSIPPLTGHLQDLQQKMQPQVFQLYGAALQGAGGQMGLLGELATKTGDVLNKWAADIVVKLQSGGKGLQDFIKIGEQDLAQFGNILASLGHIFGTFLQATQITHVAEDLLAGLAVVIHGLSVALGGIGAPALAAGIALHSLFVYGGAAVTGLKAAADSVLVLSSRFGPLSTGALSAATALGATDTQLAKIAERTPAVRAVASALDQNTASLGQFVIATGKGGSSVEEMAAKMAGGKTELAGLTEGMSKAGQDAANLAIAASGGGSGVKALANAAEDGTSGLTRVAGAADEAAGKTGILERATSLLSAVPVWAWVAAGTVALGAMVYEMETSTDATQKWAASLQGTVEQARGLQQIAVTLQDLSAVTSAQAANQRQFNTIMQQGQQFVTNYATGMTTLSGSYEQNRADSGALAAAHGQLSRDLNTEVTNVVALARTYGVSYVEAAELAGNANADLTHYLQGNTQAGREAAQQIKDLIAGYGGMAVVQGTLGSDMNAVTFASEEQNSAVTKLNQAFDTFIKTVQAPSGSFLSFAQSLQTIDTAAKTAGASMTGLNAPSLQLRTDFNSAVSAAEPMIDSLRTAAQITGNGGPVVSGVKATAAALIPLAGSSKDARDQIFAMAQEAGYAGPDSLKALATWTGNVKDPMQALDKLTRQAGTSMANLGNDAKALAQTIQTSLNQTLVQQAEALTGVSAKSATYLSYLQQYGPADARTQAALQNLNGAQSQANYLATTGASNLNALTGKTQSYAQAAAASQSVRQQVAKDFDAQQTAAGKARTALDAYGTTIHQNQALSDAAKNARQQLIKDLENAGVSSKTATTDVGTYTTAVQKNGTTSDAAKNARKQLITDILNASNNAKTGRTDMDNLTTAVQRHGATAQSYAGVRAQLIKDLENTGLNAQTATTLVDGLITSLKNIPPNPQSHIQVQGTGSFSVTSSSGNVGAIHRTVGRGAGGGVFPGYAPGVDSLLAWVSPGEGLLVPEAVQAVGPEAIHALNRKYGKGRKSTGMSFYGGGVMNPSITGVTGSFPESAAVDQEGLWAESSIESDKASGEPATIWAIQAAVAAALAAAEVQSSPGFGAAASGPLQDYAKKLLAGYGWSGQWPAFADIVARESGWNVHATNPSSGAYGIPQALPGSKMASAGSDWQSSGYTQLRWMLGYIKDRYGSPNAADAHEISSHWYDGGGWVPPGMSLALNGTGRPEPVLSSKQWDMLASAVHGGDGGSLSGHAMGRKLDRMIDLLEKAPGRTGGSLGEALNGTARSAGQRAYFRTR